MAEKAVKKSGEKKPAVKKDRAGDQGAAQAAEEGARGGQGGQGRQEARERPQEIPHGDARPAEHRRAQGQEGQEGVAPTGGAQADRTARAAEKCLGVASQDEVGEFLRQSERTDAGDFTGLVRPRGSRPEQQAILAVTGQDLAQHRRGDMTDRVARVEPDAAVEQRRIEPNRPGSVAMERTTDAATPARSIEASSAPTKQEGFQRCASRLHPITAVSR